MAQILGVALNWDFFIFHMESTLFFKSLHLKTSIHTTFRAVEFYIVIIPKLFTTRYQLICGLLVTPELFHLRTPGDLVLLVP